MFFFGFSPADIHSEANKTNNSRKWPDIPVWQSEIFAISVTANITIPTTQLFLNN